jgi:glycosyltransferase involved in cell wall biosynthesis
MKVLQIVEPGIDGVFRHVQGLSRFLAASGVGVSLAYSDVRGSVGLERLVAEVHAGGGQTLNLRVGNKPGLSDLVAAAQLRQLIQALCPDVLHAHSSKAGGLLRLPFVAPRRAPVFYTPHAYYGMAGRRGAGPWLFDGIERLLSRRGTTINISTDEAAFASQRLGLLALRQRVIHNPVQVSKFTPASPEEKHAARLALGIPPGAVVLGTAGRMCFQKDPETLYRAIAPLLRQRPELRLLHLGQGELLGLLEEVCRELGITEQVVFCGYQEDPLCFYHALDGLVMSSLYEAGWPIVILEAMACDLPFVSSLAPGTSGIDRAGLSHCWTAPARSVAGFETALRALLDDLVLQRPSNHRQTALTRFSPEVCYGAVLDEYRKATQGSAASARERPVAEEAASARME